MPPLPLATNSVMLKNIYQFSMSEIILYMYKGVIVHQLSPLNICFTTLLIKMDLACAVPITAPHALLFVLFIISKNYKTITSSF